MSEKAGVRWALIRPLLAVAAVCIAFAGCSSSGKSGSATSGGASDASQTSSGGIVAEAEAAVAQGYKGLYRTPAAGPAAVKGKNVYVIVCSFQAPGCYIPAKAIKTAGETLGWNVTLVDAKQVPAGFTAGIQQAIAAKADGIISIGGDCASTQAAYEQAKDAGIKTIGVYLVGCKDTRPGKTPNLVNGYIDMGTGQDVDQWFRDWGKLHADYIIAKTQGKAKTIAFTQSDKENDLGDVDEGFMAEMAKCTTCKVYDVSFSLNDAAGPGVVAKVSSALITRASNANSIFFDNDTELSEAMPTLQANPHPSWIVVGSEGLPTTLANVGKTVTALIAFSADWLGWCGAYSLNEVFANHAITDCGLGAQILDKGHDTQPTGASTLVPRIDYASIMKKQWTS